MWNICRKCSVSLLTIESRQSGTTMTSEWIRTEACWLDYRWSSLTPEREQVEESVEDTSTHTYIKLWSHLFSVWMKTNRQVVNAPFKVQTLVHLVLKAVWFHPRSVTTLKHCCSCSFCTSTGCSTTDTLKPEPLQQRLVLNDVWYVYKVL